LIHPGSNIRHINSAVILRVTLAVLAIVLAVRSTVRVAGHPAAIASQLH